MAEETAYRPTETDTNETTPEVHSRLGLAEILSSYVLLALIAGSIITLDQWTKEIVRSQLPVGHTWMPLDWLAPYARIIHWQNRGAAFGMFQEGGGLFAVLAVIVSAIIIFYYPRVPRSDWTLRLALGMQLGGAVGNLIDRLTQGGVVTDFISVWTFPVFNVADTSISLGVAILLLGVLINERREKRAQEAALAEAAERENEETPEGG